MQRIYIQIEQLIFKNGWMQKLTTTYVDIYIFDHRNPSGNSFPPKELEHILIGDAQIQVKLFGLCHQDYIVCHKIYLIRMDTLTKSSYY